MNNTANKWPIGGQYGQLAANYFFSSYRLPLPLDLITD
jgi:hypothetical protein